MPRPSAPVALAGTPQHAPSRPRPRRRVSSSISGSSVSAEPGEVPLRDRGLVAVGVAAAVVDRAEHRRRIEGVHERARAVVDRLARDRHVVGVHHAVDEPDEHPPGHQRGLGVDDALVEARGTGSSASAASRVVARDRVVGQPRAERRVAGARGVLERADPQVARRDPRQHRAGQHGLAHDRARRWRRRPAPAWSGCRARASPRRSRTRAASARPRPCRRRRGRTACARSPSGAGRAAAVACRRTSPSSSARPSPRRGEYTPNWCPA